MAFIINWFHNPSLPGEMHALALQMDDSTGFYNKCLIRVPFSDFAFILFADNPEPALIDRARRAAGTRSSMRLNKVKTIAGYQAKPTVPALFLMSNDIAGLLKLPEVKALGGYVEEHTSISRSRKLTALRGMSQCCWIELTGMTVLGESDPTRVSKAGITEYKSQSWENLTPRSLESQEAFTPPSSKNVKVLSFDIEVYKPSQRGGGMPDATDPINFIMCISVIVHEQSVLSEVGRRTITIHTIFDVAKVDEYIPMGTRIFRYATEYEMINGFWEHVSIEDPVLILGFNVQSWDFRYINARMKHHGITYPSSLSIYARSSERIGMRRSQWSSDAFKHNDMLWPEVPGMVVLDLHKFYKRSRPSLRKHSLDYISRHYLGRGKFPVSQERMVKAYESGDPDELSAMAQYNIEDSMLVLDIFLREQVFDEAALEAITSETLIDDLYTKGMGIRTLNKLYRYAKEEGYVVTTSPALSIARGQGGGGGESQLVGASVQGDSPGRYDDVAVYDIRSMYPTLLLSKNICYTTFLHEVTAKSPEHAVYPWETKGEDDTKPREVHEAAFVTENVQRGLCSRLLSDQLILRERIKSWNDPTGVLKYAQRGVKAVSNSLIGIMGMAYDSARMTFPAAAGVVYTAARSTIKAVIQDVSQWEEAAHGPVVYSDTDSVLVSGMPKVEDRVALLNYLNAKFSPFIFELEAVGRLLLVGPKNYIMRYSNDGNLVYRGVSFSRRNASDFVSQAMQEVTAMIMDDDGHSRADILKYMKNRIERIQEEELDSFVMSATVSAAASTIGGKLGRRLMANGVILAPGDVVDYVVLNKPLSEIQGCSEPKIVQYTKTGKVKKDKAPGITDRGASVEELEKCHVDYKAVIDYEYYADKLRTSVEQLLVFD